MILNKITLVKIICSCNSECNAFFLLKKYFYLKHYQVGQASLIYRGLIHETGALTQTAILNFKMSNYKY